MLVVGAGKVALRKTRGLLEAGARITVVAPECEPEFEDLPVRLVRRRFRASDLANALLVFAATDDRLTNHRIAIAAKGRGQFANIADSAEECGFLVPARVHRGEVQIAVSTGGKVRASPRSYARNSKRSYRLGMLPPIIPAESVLAVKPAGREVCPTVLLESNHPDAHSGPQR